MSYRLFIALDIEPGVRRKLHAAAAGLPVGDSKINFVAADSIHLTLHFIGGVADDRQMDLHLAVERAAGEVGGFDFAVTGLQAVPAQGRLRMIWAGVVEPTGRLATLHELLGASLREAGFQTDHRPFSPHITLARAKSARDPAAIRQAVAAVEDEPFGTCHAEEIVVYSSQLTRNGPIYESMGHASLTG